MFSEWTIGEIALTFNNKDIPEQVLKIVQRYYKE